MINVIHFKLIQWPVTQKTYALIFFTNHPVLYIEGTLCCTRS